MKCSNIGHKLEHKIRLVERKQQVDWFSCFFAGDDDDGDDVEVMLGEHNVTLVVLFCC